MSGYRISEVAERTGLRPSTLRYYEDIGLAVAPYRTDAGYRGYDDRSVRRLAFIAAAKHLGLGLGEVRELAGVWDADECAAVQHRLAGFVDEKLIETQHRIGDLVAFAAQVQSMAARLAEDPPPGPCDDTCACSTPPDAVPTVVHLTEPRLRSTPHADPPIVCTLGPGDVPARLAAWQAVLREATAREAIDGGIRLAFPRRATIVAELASLAAEEQACCQFFDFSLRFNTACVEFEVRAPRDAQPILAAMFGVAP